MSAKIDPQVAGNAAQEAEQAWERYEMPSERRKIGMDGYHRNFIAGFKAAAESRDQRSQRLVAVAKAALANDFDDLPRRVRVALDALLPGDLDV